MSKPENGGPAFPGVEFYDEKPYEAHDGMTLRDYFAAKALQGLCSSGTGWPRSDDGPEMARRAYVFAAAMLAEREK